MCRFIILLLLFCNNRCCTKACSCIEPRNMRDCSNEHSHNSFTREQENCKKDYDWHEGRERAFERRENTEKHYERRENCTCTACEETAGTTSEDKSDSRNVYLNTAAVNCKK